MNGAQLFLRLVSASIKAQAQYPASTIMLTLGQFVGTVIEIIAVWAMFDRFGSVEGWTFFEVAVFYGLVNIMFAFAELLTRGFDVLGTEFIRTGAFDRVLLRPRTATLQLMGHDFRLSRLGRLAQGLLVLIIATQHSQLDWSAGMVVLALWAIAGGVALFFGILVLQATLSFWTIEGLEIGNVVTYGGVQAAQYPLSLYSDWFRGFLTFVVPLACVAYFPVLGILGKPDPLGSPAWLAPVTPLAGFAFLLMSFWVWRIGVRHYTSTGS